MIGKESIPKGRGELRMDTAQVRKDRLHTLLNLARAARGWSRAELARSLGRDPTKLIPESANPKMDYLVRLSEVLEWPVGEVVEAINVGPSNLADGMAPNQNFEELNQKLLDANRASRYEEVVELSRQMFQAARTGDERAHACIREAAGWDGMGRYPKVLEAVQRGLQQGPLSVRLRLVLQATLANAQYTLWDLTPALGTAEVLARWYESNPPEKVYDWKRVAYVHYVRGNTRRRMMATEPESRLSLAREARADLVRSAELYDRLSDELADGALRGIANTCRGGIIEIDVELGDLDAKSGVNQMLESLRQVNVQDKLIPGDWMESHGWWCIFGSNIALRHLQGRELQQSLSAFMSKALEIADRLNNWAMRERVFTMQYTLHNLMVDATGLDLAFTIDDEDRSLIGATMGRFPSFRETGWKILETARVVRA